MFLFFGCNNNSTDVLESTGTIESTQVDIRTEVGGQILKLYFSEGDRVKPGDILAEIDIEKLEWELKSAEAVLREIEARLALLQYGFRDEEVRKAEEALKEAEILLAEAERDNRRIQKLFEEGVVSEHDRDRAETLYQSSLKQYERAKSDSMIFKEGYRAEEIEAAKASRESAEARVGLLKRTVRDGKVKSHVEGIISEKYVETSEFVSPGSLICTITDLQDTWIMAYVSERHLGRVHYEQPGYVEISAYPDRKFMGRVVYISPEAEFTPKHIQTKEERVKLVFGVKLQLENKEEILKPGMPADVVILTSN